MNKNEDLSINLSIVYRYTQKYFDTMMADYDIGYTQLLFLTIIYEKPGIAMNDLAKLGSFDKGTITKATQKLESAGYITIESSLEDKRSKILRITSKAQKFITELYAYKQNWLENITSSMNADDQKRFIELMRTASLSAVDMMNIDKEPEDETPMKFFGFYKSSLLDYPGKISAVLFTGGCNMRCPFCQNRSLVFLNENEKTYSQAEIIDYLKKRSDILDGICITGGEPLLHRNLEQFLRIVKEECHLKVKLDTNGLLYDRLKDLVEQGLIDYVAMDIKNARQKYAQTSGMGEISTRAIERSIDFLLSGNVDYEFRTTVVREYHNSSDFEKIAKRVSGAKRYYLQYYVDRPGNIQPGLHACEPEEMENFRSILAKTVQDVSIRGSKE